MILSAPATLLTAAVTVFAVLIAIANLLLVARVRGQTGIQPPAMTGDPRLERALRVQGNTTESLVMFLPALWVAAIWFQGWVPPVLGLVWCLARVVYAFGYIADPAKRHLGFVIGFLALLALVVLGAIGIVMAWTVAG